MSDIEALYGNNPAPRSVKRKRIEVKHAKYPFKFIKIGQNSLSEASGKALSGVQQSVGSKKPEQSIEPQGQSSGHVSDEILPIAGQLVAKREMGGDLLEPSDFVVSTHSATIIIEFTLK
jgi:hypothetical protein